MEKDFLDIRNIPTKADAEYPFVGEWNDVHQLTSKNNRIYVNQGHSQRSVDGSVLGSSGFGKCTAIVIQNESSPESYLLHLSDDRPTDKDYEEMDKLTPGEYTITFVIGGMSRVSKDTLTNKSISYFLHNFEKNGRKSKINDQIVVPSGNEHWSLSYDSEDKKIKVFTRKDKMVREYKTK